jgi:formylglycine-generating enzyme
MRVRDFLFWGWFLAIAAAPLAEADTFGSGENQFEIEFVTIGDPGNAADTTGEPNPVGSVPYVYGIGTYEVPEHAIRRANAATADSEMPLSITLDERGPDKPATSVSWFEAARFVNWLNEDKGAPRAYKFDDGPGGSGDFELWEPGDVGYNPANPFRNTQARYFLPSVDEWYKAAFYDPVTDSYFDYPTGMNTPPMAVASGMEANTAVYNQAGPADVMLAGGESPFGTVGQAGNSAEWQETAFDLLNDSTFENRNIANRDWTQGTVEAVAFSLSNEARLSVRPFIEPISVGIRVISVPEPSTLMTAFVLISLLILQRQLLTYQRTKEGFACASLHLRDWKIAACWQR